MNLNHKAIVFWVGSNSVIENLRIGSYMQGKGRGTFNLLPNLPLLCQRGREGGRGTEKKGAKRKELSM